MSLNDILATLSQPSWLADPATAILHRDKYTLTKAESSTLRDNARTALEVNDVMSAANNLYVGLLLDEHRFLFRLQKDGLLRISRYSYEPSPLTQVVNSLLDSGLGLSPLVTSYLESLVNLYKVAESVHKDYSALRKWLNEERETGVKSALAWLDLLFLKAAVGFHSTSNRHVTSRHPFFFDVEKVAEGFSSLLALYGNEFGNLTKNPPINEVASNQGRYLGILNAAAHLPAFREWEFLVDRFGYRLLPTGQPGEFTLQAPSPEFLRAMELGFIQSSVQRIIKATDWSHGDDKSLHDYAPKLMKAMEKAGLIRLLEQPTVRYHFDFREDGLKNIAKLEEFFHEERIALLQASRDLLTDPEALLNFDVHEGVKFGDLFRVVRIMQYIRSIVAVKLVPELKRLPGIVLNSIVPVFEREQLNRLLAAAVSPEVAERIIGLWTTDVTGHVDIQYRPLIPAGGSTLLLPVNVLANSNLYRNPLQVLQRRLYEDGTVDPLTELIAKACQGRGYDAKAGFNYDKGEIDVLVMSDGIVFALECKNSLVPSGPHELLTSWDYIQIAADQLERFKTRFAENQFRQWLANETGWQVNQDTRLVTGIVLSNRMFVGYREGGHPIRGAYDLEHFVNDGTISMGDEVYRYWLGDTFTGEDLRRYFEDDLTYLAQWDCLKPYSAVYQFDGCTVCVDHLYSDQIALAEHYGFQKAKQGLLQQQAAYSKAVDGYSLTKQYEKDFHELKRKDDRKERRKRNRKRDRKLSESRSQKKRKWRGPEHD